MFKKVKEDPLGTGFDFEIGNQYIKVRDSDGFNLAINKNYNTDSYRAIIYIPYNDKTVFKVSNAIINRLRTENIVDFDYRMSDFLAYIAKEEKFNFNYYSGFGTIYFNNFKDLECRPMSKTAKFLEAVGIYMGFAIPAMALTPVIPLIGVPLLLAGVTVYAYGSWTSEEMKEGRDRPTICSALKKKFHKIREHFYNKAKLEEPAARKNETLFKQVHKLDEKITSLDTLVKNAQSPKKYKKLKKVLEKNEKKIVEYFNSANKFNKDIPGVVIAYGSKDENDLDRFVNLALGVKAIDMTKISRNDFDNYDICSSWLIAGNLPSDEFFSRSKIEKSVRKRVSREVGDKYLSESIRENLAILTVNKAFEGENSTLQKMLLNLEKSGLVHAVEFAREKALEKIYTKLRDNVRLGNYSKVHPGEYYIIAREKQDNILNLDDVKEYIETRLATNPKDFSKIRTSLEEEGVDWSFSIKIP